ncbi:MAG: isopentenyl phosphate kinase [Herpetosiphon sp.]
MKLGGSVLTDKTRPEALNVPVLQHVATALAVGIAQSPATGVILGHGGGSFGHYWAQHYSTANGVVDHRGWEGFARVQDAQGRLNRSVLEILIAAGIPAVSVQPSAGAIARDRALVRWDVTALKAMLSNGLIPVIYGDVLVDLAQGATICSTETLFAYLAVHLAVNRIILVGESGVFTADPHTDPRARLIPTIDQHNIDVVLSGTSGSYGVDVTGGMASKVMAMWELTAHCPQLEICFIGPQSLRDALAGNPTDGTVLRRSVN